MQLTSRTGLKRAQRIGVGSLSSVIRTPPNRAGIRAVGLSPSSKITPATLGAWYARFKGVPATYPQADPDLTLLSRSYSVDSAS